VDSANDYYSDEEGTVAQVNNPVVYLCFCELCCPPDNFIDKKIDNLRQHEIHGEQKKGLYDRGLNAMKIV
jgi:hypothetical protein